MAELIVISQGYDVAGAANVSKFAAVRVRQGKYLVRLRCNGMFVGTFDLTVDAQAGGEYLLECSGDGHGMDAHVWRKDRPTEDTTASAATGAAEQAAAPAAPPAPSTWTPPWQR
ncbi:hypothetical protein LF41_628 [Lysobacter dokdonensis DS-58]|uniref:Uncharacterized protein n=1 Tax=Lysobacter dokdonensis DS-58 TaxID=1300345 RepID=A0A0A2WIQ9_9GAMM|nr:hypothetical protein [Lysobacter dokdonensis]KGQ18602.1 hypothetical protein LF41_628 [Lysobacter dokdonensis DS-58]